jgi:hypothetical protein
MVGLINWRPTFTRSQIKVNLTTIGEVKLGNHHFNSPGTWNWNWLGFLSFILILAQCVVDKLKMVYNNKVPCISAFVRSWIIYKQLASLLYLTRLVYLNSLVIVLVLACLYLLHTYLNMAGMEVKNSGVTRSHHSYCQQQPIQTLIEFRDWE